MINLVLFDVLIIVVMAMACILAFVLGFLTAIDTKGIDEHRAFLKGYKQGLKEGRRKRRNGNSNRMRQMQEGNKREEQDSKNQSNE